MKETEQSFQPKNDIDQESPSVPIRPKPGEKNKSAVYHMILGIVAEKRGELPPNQPLILNQVETGAAVGVTRERARQIIKRKNYCN